MSNNRDDQTAMFEFRPWSPWSHRAGFHRYNKAEKPLGGIEPRHIHDQKRRDAIFDAMIRYCNESKPIPVEWVEELRDLTNV